jgi:hypothetical protein
MSPWFPLVVAGILPFINGPEIIFLHGLPAPTGIGSAKLRRGLFDQGFDSQRDSDIGQDFGDGLLKGFS